MEEFLDSYSFNIKSPCWDLFLKGDGVERAAIRREQIMYLARYGRQPINMWDDMEVPEFLAYYRALGAIIEREHGSSGEDG